MPASVVVAAGLAWGGVLFLAFQRFVNHAAVREWKRKRRAYVLALYIFGEDPLIVLRNCGRIARANLMLLRYTLPAIALAAPLAGAAWYALDAYQARAQLYPGRTAVATASWSAACEPQLVTPAWLRTDSPPVHAAAAGEVSWRVRVLARGTGAARIGCGGRWVDARLETAAPPEHWFLWFAAAASLTAWLLSLAKRLLGPLAEVL